MIDRNLAKRLIPLIGVCFVLGLFISPAKAQVKYSPEHPEVKAMADAAMGSLRVGGDVGEATLSALAILQYYKRYEGRVPKNHAGINNAIGQILKMFPGGGNGKIMEQSECYFPALALILLCEYDAVKYEKEINELLEMFKDRQRPTGAFTYLGQNNTGDTSQTQFAALAIWVAKTKGFNIDLPMAEKTLNWLCTIHRGSGQWSYKYTAGGSSQTSTLSMQAAGLSSVYLMADCLQLYARRKDMTKNTGGEAGLPRTVRIWIPPKEGASTKRDGPLVNFDRGLLGATVNAGNRSLESRFRYDLKSWNYYYLYAIERYAYFREQAEGDTGSGVFADWYDQGIEFLKTEQRGDGGFPNFQIENKRIATAFALLYMVRSSEIINLPPADSRLQGNNKFATEGILRDSGDGTVSEVRPEQNLQDMLKMLGDKQANQEQLERMVAALKKQIAEFRKKDDKSRGEIKAFLRSMIGAKNYYRRMIAVKFLAGEQDMNNVPALIYGLSDPDLRVAVEAHDGLRLISRKIDSMKLSDRAAANARRDPDVVAKEAGLEDDIRSELAAMERKWVKWFLSIRPDAELLGSNNDSN
ncbi:MAG: hypothetical protein AAFN77_01070 [Planctomycetota bacterium]